MKRKAMALMASVLCVAMLAACGGKESQEGSKDAKSERETVTASGSSALFPLADAAAVAFKEKNPNVAITINAGGSGTGLKDVAAKTVDIGNSDVYAEEKLDAETAKTLVDHKACVVSMTPVINTALAEKVPNLTTEQLTKIFTAEITNWSEVGGPDEQIMLITRPTSSGTRALFKEYGINGAEEASTTFETDDSGSLLTTVAQNENAIGYVALSYLVNEPEGVAKVKINDIECTLETTYDGTWEIWGYEHMYTNGEPTGAVKDYLDFIMGEEFGTHIEEMGYAVTSKMEVTR